MTVPVAVAIAERSFYKLKLIKNFLRSSMSQERLSDLALLSIDNEKAKSLNFSLVQKQDGKISSFQPPACKLL